MITALRSILKSHAYRIFLWIFLAIMVFGGISFDFSDNKPWAIKVFKQKATEMDFRQAVSNSQRQYDYLKAQGITWPRTESIEKEVLRHMISNLLLQNVAEELALVVPSMLLSEQLASQLSSLPAHFFDKQGNLNVAMLEKIIAPRSFESLLQDMENEIKANLLNNLILIGSYVPQFQVVQQFKQDYTDKQYSVLTFSFEKALKKAEQKAVSNEVLERFYKKAEHGDTYKTLEKRAGRYWKFHGKEYGLTVSKPDIAAYYDKHKQSEYLETPAQVQVHRIFFADNAQDDTHNARELAQHLHDQLVQDPTTFAATAKKISAAKLATQGSEKTDFFAKDSDQYDKIFVETAFEQLTEDGQISSVIKTEKGYEVLQRIARKSAKYKKMHDVQDHIEEKLLQEKFAKRFKQDAERLVSNALYNKEALPAFIQKKHGHAESLGLSTKKAGVINMQLFQTEQGSYAVFMDDKDGIILECTQVDKKTFKPFEEVASAVRQDYYKKQAQQELQSIAADAMQDAATMDLHALAKKYEAHLHTAASSFKNGQMDHDALLRRPEIMPKLKSLQSAGSMIDVAGASESYLIRLDEMSDMDDELFESKKSSMENTLASQAKYQGRDRFVASLYRDAKLKDKIAVKIEVKE